MLLAKAISPVRVVPDFLFDPKAVVRSVLDRLGPTAKCSYDGRRRTGAFALLAVLKPWAERPPPESSPHHELTRHTSPKWSCQARRAQPVLVTSPA
jgi:hypothetical protein